MFLPGGDSGLHRAHIAVAAVAGAADRADDNIVDDQREAAGYQNDLAFHQAQRAVKALGIGLQLIGGFRGALLQRHRADRLANGELYPEARGAVHGVQRYQIAVEVDYGDGSAAVFSFYHGFRRLNDNPRLFQCQRCRYADHRARGAVRRSR